MSQARPANPATGGWRDFWRRPGFLPDLAVAALALSGAAWLFLSYLPGSDSLWRDIFHDRNAHLTAGMRIGLAIRELDMVALLDQLQRSRVWPPLHSIVLGTMFAVTDVDHRLGVLPSLLGWALTVFFSWKIALRLFASRPAGLAAGFVAVALAFGSPVFALVSTDVMLEGLGSALSAFCLWAFIAAAQEVEKPWRWKLLGLGLTLLFFEKYNYFGFVAATLAVTSLILFQPVRVWLLTALNAFLRYLPRLARNPFFIAGLVGLALVFYVQSRGPTSFELFGEDVSLYPPHTLLTIAFACMFIAALQVWRAEKAALRQALGLPGVTILAWHVLPVAISFLVPQRLSAFAWFVSPSNAGYYSAFDPAGGLRLYANTFLDGFVAAPWIGLVVLALAVVPFLGYRAMAREWLVIPVFLAVCLAALILHPQHQPRFLTTVVFALWISAGAGFAILLRAVLATRPLPMVATAMVAAVCLLAFQLGQPYRQEARFIAMRQASGASDLELARAYIPDLDLTRPLAMASTFGVSDLLYWPLMEHCRCLVTMERLWVDAADPREVVAEKARLWMATVPVTQMVVVDMPTVRSVLVDYANTQGIADALAGETGFVEKALIEHPDPKGRIHVLVRR